MASGAWESIIINGRRFACKSDDSVSFKLDGFENETITAGDGSAYLKKTRHTGSISGINVICIPENGDFEFLQETQDALDFVDISGTMLDGSVLSGKMQITDAIEFDSSENVAELTLEGHLEKQG